MKVLVTGFTQGIGYDLTKKLLLQGHEVWGVARNPESDLKVNFSSACDVSDFASLEKVNNEVKTEWGHLDSLILCAGVQGAIGPAMTLDPIDWNKTVEVNLSGPYFCIRAFFETMMASPGTGRRKVICFSGGGGTGSRPNFSAYSVAKTGVIRLVEILADEWRELPIDINAIAPGAISTRLTDEVLRLGSKVVGKKEFEQATKVKQSGGGSLEKVSGLINFLLSADSDGLTGKIIAAQWDPWSEWVSVESRSKVIQSEQYTLRRTVP